MAVEWKESLAVGVKEIDDQHKELFKRVNDLFEACNQGKGKEEVGKIINFLGDYVISHFNTEEKLQQKYNYPDYPSHKKEHELFIQEFTELKKQFEAEGPTGLFVIKINKKVIDWLIQHIGRVDKALGAYLKDKI